MGERRWVKRYIFEMRKILLSLSTAILFGASSCILMYANQELPKVKILKNTFYYYETKKGESLAGIAKNFGWDLQTLERYNRDVMLPLSAGTLLYYPADRNPVSGKTLENEKIQENGNIVEKPVPDVSDGNAADRIVIESMTTYKAHRSDDWSGIAEKFGISEDLLKSANPEIFKIKKGNILQIPKISDIQIDERPDAEDSSEKTDSITAEAIEVIPEVSVAIVLSDADSNKDMEFSRGALLAVSRMKDAPYQTRLTIIDGQLPGSQVLDSLESFMPSYIVSTSGRSLPELLKEFCNEKNVPLVNAFDAKDESYASDKNIIQIQSPSDYFNGRVGDYLSKRFVGRRLMVVGQMEQGDTMGENIAALVSGGDENMVEEMDVASLPEIDLDPASDYLVYATPSKRDDVRNLLEKVTVMRDRNPVCKISVVGRPSWITFADSQKELFGMNGVILPTRFYFNADAPESRKFIEDYKELFGHTPLKSYPVYSATAYDILTSLTPAMLQAGDSGLENVALSGRTLQTSMGLVRETPASGLANGDVFVVEYNLYDEPEVIKLGNNQ